MLQSRKFWFFLVCAATLLTAFIFLFNYTGTREKALQLITPDLIEEKGHLKNENAYLKSELDSLKKLNRSLRKYLDLYADDSTLRFRTLFSDLGRTLSQVGVCIDHQTVM